MVVKSRKPYGAKLVMTERFLPAGINACELSAKLFWIFAFTATCSPKLITVSVGGCQNMCITDSSTESKERLAFHILCSKIIDKLLK